MWDTLIRVWGAIAVPISIAITTLYNRRHTNEIEDTDSTARTMTAITDSAGDMIEHMRAALKPLQDQLDSQAELIHAQGEHITSNESELAKHLTRIIDQEREIERLNRRIVLQGHQLKAFQLWAVQLRDQVVEAGFEPIPPPPEVATVLNPNNKENEE